MRKYILAAFLTACLASLFWFWYIYVVKPLLLPEDGPYGLLLRLGVPVSLSALPLLIPRRVAMVIAAIGLTAWSVITSFTVGVLYVPSACLMWVAAAKERTRWTVGPM